ncbi:MAG: hypothetical protein U1B77_01100 [Dehalococcoidales bacterium]|nr:hypothetical protein [Dehalococcoidales bacterium]
MNADIIAIAAPSSVPAGEQVAVDVSVKNISSSDQYIAVTAVYNSASFPFQFDYLMVSSGQTVIFRGVFTMPSENVKVTAWSWSWDGGQWVQDDQMTKDIALAVLTPQVNEFQILDFSKV